MATPQRAPTTLNSRKGLAASDCAVGNPIAARPPRSARHAPARRARRSGNGRRAHPPAHTSGGHLEPAIASCKSIHVKIDLPDSQIVSLISQDNIIS